jgi:Ca2+-binding EF-hand superfamily protein
MSSTRKPNRTNSGEVQKKEKSRKSSNIKRKIELTEDQKVQIRQAFDVFDNDGIGIISNSSDLLLQELLI